MYKKILGLMLLILILVIGAFIAIIYLDVNENYFTKEKETNSNAGIENENVSEVVKVGNVEENEENIDKYVNPFHEEYKQEELRDRHYQDYIHKMSHQKVIADTKWGFYKITDVRIDWLLASLDVTYDFLDEGKVYREILTKWKNEDFSKVDQDHNTIWNLQGGSIGEATGILSTEEEKEYIENTREEKGKTE